jgi:tetratricopeptide (TPR) repeat protein
VKLDSIVFGVAGVCFGVIVGWVLGSQQTSRNPAVARAAAEQSASTQQAAQTPPPLDESRVQSLRSTAESDPKNIEARIQLANLYYDAERYEQAIPWYQQALTIDPSNVDVSTDLGVSFYQMNQADKALQQFDYSLKLNPKHVKTLLNVGVVSAFGKQDLDGAVKAWKQVVEVAPGSQEAQMAQRAIDSVASAHATLGNAAPPAPPDK